MQKRNEMHTNESKYKSLYTKKDDKQLELDLHLAHPAHASLFSNGALIEQEQDYIADAIEQAKDYSENEHQRIHDFSKH